MDEFKSEDEFRPDSSNRHPSHQRKGSTVPKVPVSRQRLIIGIGILMLLLLVISIGSALKSPSRTDSSRHSTDNKGQRNIDSCGSSLGSNTTSLSSPGALAPAANNSQTNGAPVTMNDRDNVPLPQKLRGPQVASTLTKAAQITTPTQKQRTKLASNVDALTQQKSQINSSVAAQINGQRPISSTLPDVTRTIQSAPAGYYTLQLSSASQPATLNAYARQHQLSHCWVYQTRRDGKPWYVLVNGVYSSLSQAKNAVAQLPADVQAKKPWARQISQVKRDQNN